MATVVLDDRVVEALSFARRELRLAPIAGTPPLLHSIVRAAFEQLTVEHDWELRLALWLVLAVATPSQRTAPLPSVNTSTEYSLARATQFR